MTHFLARASVALPFILVAVVAAGCGGSRAHARRPVDPDMVAVAELPEGAFSVAAPAHVCRTVCAIPSASEATPESSPRVAAGLDPAMSSLRGCLSSIGASEVDPVIFATYAPNGTLALATIDIGGIEARGCVERARAVLPVRTADASGLLRCAQRCSSPVD